MDELHQDILGIWSKFDSLPVPSPSHRNRTITAWGTAISEAMPELTRASNRAFALQNELKRSNEHTRKLAAEIERLRGENRLLLDALGMEKYRVRWRPAYGVEMPVSNVPVLAVVQEGQKRLVVRATYIKAGQVEADLDYDEAYEYDEEADTYWLNPGWYEHNLVEEIHWQISGTVTHWAPLPGLPEEVGE